jgi:hypothetical protein
MDTEIILTAVGWAAAVASAEVTVSNAYRSASARWRALPRWSPRVADHGLLLPELSGAVCFASLACAGVFPLLSAVAALILFAIATVPLANIMRIAVRQGQGRFAAKRIGSMLALLGRTAKSFFTEDLRALTRRGGDAGDGPPPAGGPVRMRATPGVPPWRRSVPGVPSITADPALGPVPPAAEVSAALAASGVMVPAEWAAVASAAADFEPEGDEDLCEHMDGEVAGILTWAEGVMARAETLGDVVGLDPAYIAAQWEFADDVAELAAHGAQVMRRYHDYHDDLREAADGKPLPPRFWFGDGGDRAVGPAHGDGSGRAAGAA